MNQAKRHPHIRKEQRSFIIEKRDPSRTVVLICELQNEVVDFLSTLHTLLWWRGVTTESGADNSTWMRKERVTSREWERL